MFDVKSGESKKYYRFEYKLKQVEFNLGSSQFLIVLDEFKQNTPSRIKVFNFKYFLESQVPEGKNLVPTYDFETLLPEEKQSIKNTTRALWYVDGKSFFAATNDGYIIHYDTTGAVKGKALLHEGNKINSICFSKDF